MVKKEFSDLIKKQLILIKPTEAEFIELDRKTKELINYIESSIKKYKIEAKVFIGGSFAKKTIIKKKKYDIDLFVRFSQKTKANLSDTLQKLLPKKTVRVHGSRDYFSIKEGVIEFEIIPVLNISKPSQAENITDLSYFHVKYISEKIKKSPSLANEILIAKAFAHSAECYGAESYINGFSGYALELLLVYYKSFLNFLKSIVKQDIEKEKIILDPEKLYKNKEEINMHMNESKTQSPIIVVDPTFKERNALAALSYETFKKFQQISKAFFKKPNKSFFETKDKEKEFMNKQAKKKNKIIKLELATNKQAGDIAGTKMKKFSAYLINQASRYMDIIGSEFIYNDNQNKGLILLSAKPKNEIIFPGPPIEMKECLKKFKQEHRKIFIKNNQAFAKEKSFKSFKEFLSFFENKYSDVIASMDITDIKSI